MFIRDFVGNSESKWKFSSKAVSHIHFFIFMYQKREHVSLSSWDVHHKSFFSCEDTELLRVLKGTQMLPVLYLWPGYITSYRRQGITISNASLLISYFRAQGPFYVGGMPTFYPYLRSEMLQLSS